MVITESVKLPSFKSLRVQEANLSTCTLVSAAPYLGKDCQSINNEFMLCRTENMKDPRPCVPLGKRVTECALTLFKKIKDNCLHEFNQYSHCIDKSSTDYKYSPCRKTQAVFDKCMLDKLKIERPHWGHFTRARVHCSKCAPPRKEEPCPCAPKYPDSTPHLPDCKMEQRIPSRFTGRSAYFAE